MLYVYALVFLVCSATAETCATDPVKTFSSHDRCLAAAATRAMEVNLGLDRVQFWTACVRVMVRPQEES